jgi:hypothetical protein
MSSTHQPTTRPGAAQQPAGEYPQYQPYDDSTAGMTGLAGWLLILGGFWSFLVGLAVLVRKSYFTSLPNYSSISHYAYHWNLTGWGWANLILGILVVAAGVCVLLGQAWARWTGLVLAVISAIGSFLFIPYHPFWSILVIAVDVFIVWALATARRRQDV